DCKVRVRAGIKATEFSVPVSGLVYEVVFLNGHSYALLITCLAYAYYPAGAVNTNGIRQSNLGRQGHDKIDGIAFCNFRVHIKEDTTRTYVTGMAGNVAGATFGKFHRDRQVEGKAPG